MRAIKRLYRSSDIMIEKTLKGRRTGTMQTIIIAANLQSKHVSTNCDIQYTASKNNV
jgi:hypothetical protein